MIDPGQVAMFIPPGLKKFKLDLFERIGAKVIAAGGCTVRHDYEAVIKLPDELIPVVGVSPQFRGAFADWQRRGRNFIFWDRGYLRRVFATWHPTGAQLGVPGGYYRWTLNAFQMQSIEDVPDDRWRALKIEDQVKPWNKGGRHVLIAHTGHDYWDVFADRDWTSRTAAYLRTITDRPVIIRDKESRVPLYADLKGAHCLVTHGSIAAVEAVVMGYPVFVDPVCTARLVGKTDLSEIEQPAYPERLAWLRSLAYCQFNEQELVDGTLFRLIR